MIAQINPNYIKTRPMKALTRFMSYALFEGRPVTTKGRWINPLVFSILKVASRNKNGYKPVKKPIFILGTGRSGTTILGIVLSMHKEVGYLNEPKAIWHLTHPHEDIIGNYSRDDAKFRLDAEDATDDMRQRVTQMFGAYLTVTCAKRLVDKYPELIFRVDFVRSLFPDARFIFLVRNGWDTCQSIAAWSKRLGVEINGEKHDWWGVNDRKWQFLVEQLVKTTPVFSEITDEIKGFDQHLDRAAVEWILTMQEGLHLLQTSPDCVQLFRFEDLTANPDETLAELCSFCELPADNTFSEYARQTLHPVAPRKPFDLHPKLAPIFHDIMEKLRYNSY